MNKELEKEKIKRAHLALLDLYESTLYDYYVGKEMILTNKYGWERFELLDLIDKLKTQI